MDVKVGDTIKIIHMKDEPGYDGTIGVVDLIDDAGQLHGTWGGLALVPELDNFIVVEEEYAQFKYKIKNN